MCYFQDKNDNFWIETAVVNGASTVNTSKFSNFMQFLETVVLKENLHVKTVMTWTIRGYLEGLLKFTITTVKERNLFMIRHLILPTMKWFSIGLEKNGQRTAGMEVIYINILIFTSVCPYVGHWSVTLHRFLILLAPGASSEICSSMSVPAKPGFLVFNKIFYLGSN